VLLFSQLPTARPSSSLSCLQLSPLGAGVPGAMPQPLAAAHRASASRPPTGLPPPPAAPRSPLPHDLDLQQSAAGCHPLLLVLASGACNEGGAQETNAGAKMVDLRWSQTELRNRGSSSVFGLQRAGLQGLLRRSRLPASRLAGLRVEPEPLLEPCQTGP